MVHDFNAMHAVSNHTPSLSDGFLLCTAQNEELHGTFGT